jgi:hypothetical protein
MPQRGACVHDTELAEGAKTAEKALDYYELQGGVCG